MPTYKITGPDGSTYQVNAPDGASEADVLAYAQRSFKMAAAPKPEKPFGEQLNDTIHDLPRQLGLTARYGLEGAGGIADMVTSPIRGALNLIPGVDIKPGMGQAAASLLNLPQPQNARERIVGDASRMVAGSMLPLAAGAGLAKNGSGVAQGVGQMLASNPVQQIASAGASGAAGGYTRETGGNDTSQLAASLAAGLAAPLAVNGIQRGATAVARQLSSAAAPSPQQIAQIDITINNALQPSGLSLGDLPAQVAQGIRDDVGKAFRTSDQVSPDAVRRLADYRLTGLTPTAGGLTLDPAIVTQQKNLAKLGINSKDQVAQQLGQTQNANNRALTQGLNGLGAATADDPFAGGEKIIGALDQRNTRAQQLINQEYTAARGTDGRSAALDPHAFTNKANDLLDEALLGGKLPSDVRNLLNKAATGEMPLTVDVAEQFKTRIGDLQRASSDAAERKALGMVRSALNDTPLLPGQQIGQDAIDAFNKARSLNRSWMQIVERTPALQAVRDGIEPDKFVQQFIVGGGGKSNVMDVAMLKNSIKANPEAMDAVRTQIAAFLKQKALGGAADEVGNFSQSAFNKALTSIGDRKLNLFFKPDEINQLKAIGRVSSYEQFQPAGSAVNNSNTAGAGGAMLLDRIASSPLLSKLPFGQQAIAQPLQNITLGIQAGRAMDVPRTLAVPRSPALLGRQGLMVSPAAFIGLDNEEERQRRLLAPGR